ncbi:GDP-L-fucose synthase [Propionicimonas sp. T2.31MG-18]
MIQTLVRMKRPAVLLLALWDAGAWIAATLGLAVARFEFDPSRVPWLLCLGYALTCATLQLVLGAVTRVYRGRHVPGSYREAVHLGLAAVVVGLSVGGFWAIVLGGFPRSMVLAVPPAALFFMAIGRVGARAARSFLVRSQQPKDAERVLIYGAGNGGRILSRMLADDVHSPYEVAGVIDDDPHKTHQQVGRVKVLGTGAELVRVAREEGVRTVILAIPSASKSLVRRVSDQAEQAGLSLLILPKVQDIVGRTVGVTAVRKLEIDDLLGRGQVMTDLHAIAGYLTGKVVLVTGAGGSIGAELAKQLARLGPASLVLLDRDESALHGVQLEIYGKGLLDTRDMVLCDIRDQEALDRTFFEHRPDVVFHAAALKHLPMLESYPSEGWKTNVLGTLNVLECAERYGVERVVNISTDKAANPISVLGKSKRLAEELTSAFAARTGRTYVSVRFGNVLGSRGSVLHTFFRQVEDGGPVTVVHPEITRYFMTIPEACQLTIQAGAIGEPGNVMVLDMGEPIRILDVAERIIRRSGKQVPIVFTGLRPGEKLHEVLFNEAEFPVRTQHPLISRVAVPPRDPEAVRAMSADTFLARQRVASA